MIVILHCANNNLIWFPFLCNKMSLTSIFTILRSLEIPVASTTVSPTISSTSSISIVSTPPPTPECRFKNLPISRDRFWNKQLQGHVIWHQYVLSEVMCEDLCLRAPRCVAYNYQYSAEAGVKERQCELMNEVAEIQDRPGYSFRLFEHERARKVSVICDQKLLSCNDYVESIPSPTILRPTYPLRGELPYQSHVVLVENIVKHPLKLRKSISEVVA